MDYEEIDEHIIIWEKLKNNNLLEEFKDDIKNYIENNKVMLALCGGFEMLGSYENSDEGLGILNTSTSFKEKRLMGDIIIKE